MKAKQLAIVTSAAVLVEAAFLACAKKDEFVMPITNTEGWSEEMLSKFDDMITDLYTKAMRQGLLPDERTGLSEVTFG